MIVELQDSKQAMTCAGYCYGGPFGLPSYFDSDSDGYEVMYDGSSSVVYYGLMTPSSGYWGNLYISNYDPEADKTGTPDVTSTIW